MRLKTWMVEIRAPFLLLPIVLSCIGAAMAYHEGAFDAVLFVAFTAVLVLWHITVNTLNEYYDHKLGIDEHNTRRTMFNGGTGTLQAGLLSPREVLAAAVVCFIAGTVIGLALVVSVGLILLPLLVLGAVFTLLYTQGFARSMLGEVAAGLGLGFLPVLGAFMVQTGAVTLEAVLISVPSGLLTFNLLLINEFPDVEVDIPGGRKNLVTALGHRRAAVIYTTLMGLAYALPVAFAVLGFLPLTVVIGLAAVPFAFKAAVAAFGEFEEVSSFAPGLKANVQAMLLTNTLLVVAILIAAML